MSNVVPLINDDFDEHDLIEIRPNSNLGRRTLSGWILGDVVVYMAEEPVFHPLTGERLDKRI